MSKAFIIENLLKFGGIPNKIKSQIDGIVSNVYKFNPSLTEQQIIEIQEKFGAQAYCKELSKLFDEHFSEEELNQIQSFWTSTAGKKLVIGEHFLAEQNLALNWIIGIQRAVEGFKKNTEQ